MFDILKMLNDSGILKGNNAGKKNLKIKSITSAANATTFLYPALMDEDIPRDDAETIRKGVEIAYASDTQSLFLRYPAIELNDEIPDVGAYLAKFYKDLGIENKEEILDVMSRLMEASVEVSDCRRKSLFETSMSVHRLPHTLKKEILLEVSTGMDFSSEGYHNGVGLLLESYKEREAGSEGYEEENTTPYDADVDEDDDYAISEGEYRRRNNKDIRDGKRDKREEHREEREDEKFKYQQEKDEKDSSYRKSKDDRDDDYRRGKDKDQADYKKGRDAIDDARQEGRDSYQKSQDNKRDSRDMVRNFEDMATAAMPTTVNGKISIIRQGQSNPIDTWIPIHVKVFARLIRSKTFEDELIKCLSNKGAIFNFIKWTTGEKGTLKNCIIGIDEIKDEATKAARGQGAVGSSKRMKRLSKISISKLSKGVLPQATFVISLDTAERIKSITGKDLTDFKTVNKVINDLYLLGFVITDGDSMRVTFHDRGYTEIIPLTAMRRAKGKSDSFDQVLKLFKMMK